MSGDLSQNALCSRYGSAFVPPDEDENIGIAISTLGQAPLSPLMNLQTAHAAGTSVSLPGGASCWRRDNAMFGVTPACSASKVGPDYSIKRRMPVDPYSPPREAIDSDSARQPIYIARHRQYGGLVFGGSCLGLSWIAAGVAVYILGLVDGVVGQDGTFQALLMATALSSLAATVGFSLTSAATGRFTKPNKAAILGLMAAAIIPITFYLYKASLGYPPSIVPALLLTTGTGALASFSIRRVAV